MSDELKKDKQKGSEGSCSGSCSGCGSADSESSGTKGTSGAAGTSGSCGSADVSAAGHEEPSTDGGRSANRLGQSETAQLFISPMSRNNFVKGCFGCFAGMWGLMTLYPIYRYLRPAGGQEVQESVASVEIGTVDDLPRGTGKNFKFGSKPAIITCTPDGQLHAFIAICTHLGCTVQFSGEKERIWCACHGGAYDPSTGKNIAGPPPKPLSPLKVTVTDGKIVVSRPDRGGSERG